MDFDELLRQADYSSQQDLVGLAIYYLEMYEDEEGVETSRVQSLLESSRASANASTVPQRIQGLRDANPPMVKKYGEDGQAYLYVLTHEGIDEFKEVSGDSDDADKIRDDLFIDAEDVSVEYYRNLLNNINKSYQYGINDAAIVLTRKLFENLVIDILRAEYGGKGIDLYYNKDTGRFHGLGTLCGKLENKASDLKHYSRQLDNGLVARVEQFKEQGNSHAHSVRVDIDNDELEGMSSEATGLTKTLYDIREEVRIANG